MAKNKMREWLLSATREELDKLAKLSKRTVGTIRQIAGGYRTSGEARTTPEVAKQIEVATLRIAREGLAPVRREDLCPACAQCEYLKEAKHGKEK